ncbi:hypothetical protein HYALB_00009517 [Hymenoscyphus albidus]|uniref:Glucose-methanol-choline oxidoreductase N-terminal domain-containing protein n=1 Tax=Hymenoscyphus albidus TaxID=595503 RepID=A0A9N9Q6C3_9HELO|nr:hypothetical protein HYALB_00009517 [Hymenoscyphus albidus]
MRSFATSLAFVAGAYAQSKASADVNTGITFQAYSDTAGSGFSFGAAVPTTIGSDFIGQIVAPNNGSGYAGVALTPLMANSLLVIAWANGKDVVGSTYTASGYTSPTHYSNASVLIEPIAKGTFTNGTHLSYTFLCKGCVQGGITSFSSSAKDITMGFAMSSTTPTNPTSVESAGFTFHNIGFGNFGLTLAGSADYPKWASMATAVSASPISVPASDLTCSTRNVTATVSNSTYDYIIAGAGPAGIIVAQRMAESGKSVLLLEGGKASTFAQGGRSTVSWNDTVTQYDVPSMAYYLSTASDTSEYCTDTASQAGCILGGSTMVNALMFVRPQAADFNDKWPTGWKWDDVAASAAKLYERNPGTTLASRDGQRYDQGAFTAMSSFLKTMGWSQVDAIESPNEKTNVYSFPAWDIQKGLRAGPVTSYLPLAQAASNFKLTLNTKVLRAIRNGSAITGVETQDSTGARQIINVNAGGKVILAAGTMSTPRILINSGIGPKAQIDIVSASCTGIKLPAEADYINLPVGENLRDHPVFTLTFNITDNSNASTSMVASQFTNPSTTDIDLFAKASGPLAQSGQRLNFWTSLNGTSGTRFFQGTVNSPSAGLVRAKIYLTHGSTSSGSLGVTSTGSTKFITEPLMNTDEDKAAVVQFLDSMINSAKNSSVLSLASPTTGSKLVSSFTSGSHFIGTAMMGASNDGKSVVDTDTKVFGTDNLFVVDGSIHPDLPTGNTQAIIMVAAEHAAAKILALGSGSGSLSNGTSTATNSPSVPVKIGSASASVSAAQATSAVPAAPTPAKGDDACA